MYIIIIIIIYFKLSTVTFYSFNIYYYYYVFFESIFSTIKYLYIITIAKNLTTPDQIEAPNTTQPLSLTHSLTHQRIDIILSKFDYNGNIGRFSALMCIFCPQTP